MLISFEKARSKAKPGQYIEVMQIGGKARVLDARPGNWLNQTYKVSPDGALVPA